MLISLNAIQTILNATRVSTMHSKPVVSPSANTSRDIPTSIPANTWLEDTLAKELITHLQQKKTKFMKMESRVIFQNRS